MLGGCRARLGGRTGPRAEKSRSGAGEADYRPCWGCVAKARGMWAGNPGRGLAGRGWMWEGVRVSWMSQG